MFDIDLPNEFTIKILGNFWKVRVVDHPLEVDNCAVWGYKDSELSEIVISSKGNVIATFIHELQHVFAEILRIPDSTPEEDAVIERIAQMTMAFLVDNPQMVKQIVTTIERNVTNGGKYARPRVRKAKKKK